MTDRLRQLETFVAVIGHGTISAAAAAEGVAPNVLGRRLDALERRLGVRLLVRTTRRLTLTAEGAAFLEDCHRILDDIHASENAVTAGNVRATGQLRISAPAGFGRAHVAPLVPAFVARHPDVAVSLELSDALVDLGADPFDVAVRIGTLLDERLIATRLADNPRLIVASPEYLRAHGRPAHPRELAAHQCLTLRTPGSAATTTQGPLGRSWLVGLAGRTEAVRVGGSLECNDGSVLREWALAGLGLAWRSMWEVADDLAAGRLEQVLQDYRAPDLGIYAVQLQRRQQPLRTRLFVEHLKAAFAGSGRIGGVVAQARAGGPVAQDGAGGPVAPDRAGIDMAPDGASGPVAPPARPPA